MPRPRFPAGEVGAVQITKLADGRSGPDGFKLVRSWLGDFLDL